MGRGALHIATQAQSLNRTGENPDDFVKECRALRDDIFGKPVMHSEIPTSRLTTGPAGEVKEPDVFPAAQAPMPFFDIGAD